jgi:hypothetical protein
MIFYLVTFPCHSTLIRARCPCYIRGRQNFIPAGLFVFHRICLALLSVTTSHHESSMPMLLVLTLSQPLTLLNFDLHISWFCWWHVVNVLITLIGKVMTSDEFGRMSQKSIVPLFKITYMKALPWLRRLVTGFSPRRPVFAPRSVHVGFVVDKVALQYIFIRVLWFSAVNIILPYFSIIIYRQGDEQ